MESKELCGGKERREGKVKSKVFWVAMELGEREGRVFGYAEKGGLEERDEGEG